MVILIRTVIPHTITLIRTVMIRVHTSGTAATRRATIRTCRLARAGGCRWYRTADLRIEQGPWSVLDASADVVNCNGPCAPITKNRRKRTILVAATVLFTASVLAQTGL